MLKKVFLFCFLLFIFTPYFVSAVTFSEYVYEFIQPLNTLIPILVGVAVVVFIWSIIKYLASSEDPTKKEGSKRILVMGVVGIFILVSIWGIVSIVLTIFFGSPEGNPFFTNPPSPASNPGGIFPEQQQ